MQGHAASGAWRQALRDRKVRGNEADWIDHDQHSDKRGDEKFERHACRSRYPFAAFLALKNGAGREPIRFG